MLRPLLATLVVAQVSAQQYNFTYLDTLVCDWVMCETDDRASIVTTHNINITDPNEYVDYTVSATACSYRRKLHACNCPTVTQSYYTYEDVSQACSGISNGDEVDGTRLSCSCLTEPVSRNCNAVLENQTCTDGSKNLVYRIILPGTGAGDQCDFENNTVVETYSCEVATPVTCTDGYAAVGNTCVRTGYFASLRNRRNSIQNNMATSIFTSENERTNALANFDSIIEKTRHASEQRTDAQTNKPRTVDIVITASEKLEMKKLAQSGNGPSIRRSMVEAANSETDNEIAVVKLSREDFKDMFITDVDNTQEAATILDTIDSIEMQTVRPKGSGELTCNDADIHMEQVAANTLSEVLLNTVNDTSIKCLDNTLETKLTLTSTGPDVFKAECYDGSNWNVVNAALSHHETYTCNGRTHLVLSDTWASAGCESNQYFDGTLCVDHTTCGSIGVRTPGNETHDTVCECVEVGQRVLMHDGTHKNVEHLVPGDILRTPTGTTTVRSTRRGGRHLSFVHDVECADKKGSITNNHAYHCEGEWRLPKDTHAPRALQGITEVVAVETDNYCEDRMILESGLEIETWDGRGVNEWRPHTFDNGRRLRCTLKGSWRDRVLKRIDS